MNFRTICLILLQGSLLLASQATAALNDATLSSLAITPGSISPSFSPAVTNYTVSVSFLTEAITVTPTASSPNATIAVNGVPVVSGSPSVPISLDVGSDNVIVTTVTPEDRTAARSYTLRIARAATIVPARPYANIAGTYSGFEEYTMTTYASAPDGRSETRVKHGSGSGSVTVTQKGSRFSYSQTLRGFTFRKNGYLIENTLYISGIAAVALDLPPGAAITQNSFHGKGTVMDGKIVIKGTAVISGTYRGITNTIVITSTATLTGDVEHADIVRILPIIPDKARGTVLATGRYLKGTGLTLRAKPRRGYYLAKWTNAVGDTLGTSRDLALTVSGDQAVTAHFLPVGAGAYATLLQSGPLPTNSGSGHFAARLGASGVFTCKAIVSGVTHRLTGSFDGTWEFRRTIKRPHQADLVLELHLDPTNRLLTGSIQASGSSFAASIAEESAPIHTGRNPAPLAGRFTVLLPPNPANTGGTYPQGIGYLTAIVGKRGSVTATGKLADGTPFSTGGLLTTGARFPLYRNLYAAPGPHRGSILGEVTFHGNGATDDNCDGTLHWFKPMQKRGSFFRDGFEATLALDGTRYTAPARGVMALAFAAGQSNCTVTLSEGDLVGQPQPNARAATLSPSNKIAITDPNSERVHVSINTRGGSFAGWFVHPLSRRVTRFSGLLEQNPASPIAGGLFLGPVLNGHGHSGIVTITPAP